MVSIQNIKSVFSLLLLLLSGHLLAQDGLPLEASPSLWGNKNQISSISFDYSGLAVGKNRNFYNSMSKPTQSQSWDISTDKIWASETLYDWQGRGALQTLSAPIGHQFGYSSSFILDSNNSSYTASDFDGSSSINNPSTVGNQSHLQKYYSISNTDNPYQDITSHPFSRAVYSKLIPGSVLRVLGGNKIAGEWKQSYSFSMASGTELSSSLAFGSGYNTDTRVIKTVSRDVNGVDIVVFADSEGNTLAAARSGNESESQGTITNTLEIGKQGFIDIHIPQGISSFTVSNPDPSASGTLKVFNLITEAEVAPITGSTTTRTVASGFYRIAVSNTFDYEASTSGAIVVTHQVNYYEYSLNYYDKAQRLLSSKQPLNHLESTFSYNSLGQLLETSSPDEGTAKFHYRKDGQIRFSQNSKQALLGEVSFTNYDNVGRPIESGIFTTTSNFSSLLSYVDTAVPSSITSNFKELHFTIYDLPDTSLESEFRACGRIGNRYNQTFVASNVSKTYTKSPETTISWYSYDVQGRVKWMVQKIPGLSCLKTIDYVYSPVNGQVLEIDYQRHNREERFVHHYKYNSAGQLAAVYTSTNGEDRIVQAEYEYNESGALKRTVLAENLQGIDYVYNLNGQLKAINHPSLNPANDPGKDDGSTVIADVFGLSIDYYNGDYARQGTPTPVAQQNTHGTDQYNGNIKGLRFNTQGFDAQGDFSSYMYTYDKNNWLQTANFGGGTISPISGGRHKVNYTPNANNDYQVSNLSYDANGNIQSLKRNGYTAGSATNAMDDFTYHYDTTNKLQYVEDTGDNADVTLYNDLKDQSNNGSANYMYNAIGQLVVDVEGKMLYEYNASGLVTRVNTFGTGQGQSTEDFGFYSQDFETVNDSELLDWTLNTGTASVNYSGDYTLCQSLETQYQRSLRLDLTGNKKASKYFDVVSGAGHIFSLDIIAEQTRRTGYTLTIYDEEDNVLATTSYNLALANITDPDHPASNCAKYYDQSESLTFVPSTGRIKFEIQTVNVNTAIQSVVYLDNINIKLNVVPKLAFYYNDKGHRVRKEVFIENIAGTDNTYYVRDVSGNPIAIYNVPPGRIRAGTNIPEEHPVYGNSRIGVFNRDQEDASKGVYVYQLTDHLGNVRAVLMKDGTNALSLTNQTDYYPFGMPMPKRNVEDGNYRYKYQGQEKDQETGMEAFQLRMWDNRIGRWLSTDPKNQYSSPYLGMGNNPISGVDPDGGYVYIVGKDGKIYRALNAVVHSKIGNDEVGKFIDDPNNHLIFKEADLSSKNALGQTFGPFETDKKTIINEKTSLKMAKKLAKEYSEDRSERKQGTKIISEFLSNFNGEEIPVGNNYFILIDAEASLKTGHHKLVESVFHEPTSHANERFASTGNDHYRFSGHKSGLYIKGKSEKSKLGTFTREMVGLGIYDNLPLYPLNLIKFEGGKSTKVIYDDDMVSRSPRYH